MSILISEAGIKIQYYCNVTWASCISNGWPLHCLFQSMFSLTTDISLCIHFQCDPTSDNYMNPQQLACDGPMPMPGCLLIKLLFKWCVLIHMYSISQEICTRFVLCCGYTLTDFPISIRLTSLALWQSNDCPSASKATLMNMDKYFMWIHYEQLHNYNKAKHNKTVCIFLGIYCNVMLKRMNLP